MAPPNENDVRLEVDAAATNLDVIDKVIDKARELGLSTEQAEGQVSGLRGELAQLAADQHDVEHLEKFSQRTADATAKLEQMDAKLVALRSSLDAAQTRLADIGAALVDARNRQAEYTTALDVARSEAAAAEQNYQRLAAAAREAGKGDAEAAAAANAARVARDLANKTVTEYERQLRAVHGDIADLTKAEATAAGTVETLAVRLEKLVELRSEQEKAAREAAVAESALRQRLEESGLETADLAELRSELARRNQALAEKTKALDAALAENVRQAQELAQAYTALGGQSSKALQEAAAQAQTNFDALTRGGAAVRDLDLSFEQLAAAALKAAKAQGDVAAQAEATRLNALASGDAQVASLARIARELGIVQAASEESAAALLNLVPHAEIERQINEVRAAFETLKRSGTLSQTEITQAALRTQERIRELQAQTNGWAAALDKARGQLVALAASAGGLGLVAKAGIDFETAMSGVAKVVDGTDEQIAALGQRLKDLVPDLGLSAGELANIAAAGGQLGVGVGDIEKFVATVAKIGTAFGISADQAGTSVAQLMNVFGLSLDQIEALADATNALGNSTAATEKQIVDFLVRVGGSAKTFGLTAEATAALGAAFISMGKGPEVASTAVNALLTRLQTIQVQSPQAQAALNDIGVSADGLAARIAADPQQALTEFLATLARLDNQERAKAIAQIFGTEYNDDISLLVNNLGAYEKALALANDRTRTAGSLQDEFNKQQKTTSAQLDKLRNTVGLAAIDIGTALLPTIQALTAGFQNASEALQYFTSEFPTVSALATAVAVVLPALGTLKLALAAIGTAGAQGAATAGAAISGLTGGLISAQAAATKLSNVARGIGAAFVAGVAGYSIGEWAYNEFETVRKAGLTLTSALILAAEEVQKYWEKSKALFTDDTLEAAEVRHRERLAQIDATLQDMQHDAEQSGYRFGEMGAAGESAARTVQTSMQAATAVVAQTGDQAKLELEKIQAATQALGLDYGLLTTGISSDAAKQIDAFAQIAGSAQKNGALTRAAFDKVLNSVQTVEEADAVVAALHSLGKSGVETGAMLGEARTKVDELRASTEALWRAVAAGQSDGNGGMILPAGTLDLLSGAKQGLEAITTEVSELTKASTIYAEQSAQQATEQSDRDRQRAQAQDNITGSIQGSTAAAKDLLAIQQSIAGAESFDDLRQLRDALTDVYLRGKIAADDYAATLDAIKVKQKQIEDAASSGFAGALGDQIVAAENRFKAAGQEYLDLFNRLQKYQNPYKNISDYIAQTNRHIAYVQAAIDRAEKSSQTAADTSANAAAAADAASGAAGAGANNSSAILKLQDTIDSQAKQIATLKEQVSTLRSSGAGFAGETVTVRFVSGGSLVSAGSFTKDAATALIEELERAAGVALVN